MSFQNGLAIMGIHKVFGIGFSRTGTLSLHYALEKLGYKSKHYPNPYAVMRFAEMYDALTDSPVIPHYKKLEQMYPDAKFILTIRHIPDWLKSCEDHWKRIGSIVPHAEKTNRINIFGIPYFDTNVFEKTYIDHINDVEYYFAYKIHKLLTMNICNGDGYKQLCPFLGKQIINDSFPHGNKSRH